MKKTTNNTLEFHTIQNDLSNFALTEKSKQRFLSLQPFLSEKECNQKINETTEALKLINTLGTPPIAAMTDLNQTLDLVDKDGMLIPVQLESITTFITACNRMRSYLQKAESLQVHLAYYGDSFADLSALSQEIHSAIRNNQVDDNASPTLKDIRRKIETASIAMKEKLESILRRNKEWFADGYVTNRNGRFVLPVKKAYKFQVSGSVIDMSGSGGTYFIEPAAVGKLQEKLSLLQMKEENEIRKILYTLTALIYDHLNEFRINIDCMETLDFAFAKGKYSLEINGTPATITTERKIIIKQGRHPLLKKNSCVPLDFEIGNTVQGIIITGPNTGGKTVALKTIGLLSLMAQCGLHVPALKNSVFSMHVNVLCDIGDGQSIAENLSTFSAHIVNIIDILEQVSNESLVLLDELGSGTDPTEGMGLAISILEELRQRNCLFIATTHYPEIKGYAEQTPTLTNACMSFDRESLKPLYQLQIGAAGESCALYIARKLGFPNHLLERAQKEAYGHKQNSHPEIYNHDFADPGISPASSVPTKVTHSKIQKDLPPKKSSTSGISFTIGDSVTVLPSNTIGIIYQTVNKAGKLGVQIKGGKQLINHKRIKLLAPANQLYPDDYDFSIIFDSVANRKARHQFGKGYQPDLEIAYKDDSSM